MSMVLACKKDGIVYMAADTREVLGERKVSLNMPSLYKIQLLENEVLLSVVGEHQTEEVIKAYSDIFTLDADGKLTKEHIVKSIVPELVKALKEQEELECQENELPYMKAQIMLVYNDEIYEICSNFMVIKYECFFLLGRAEHALGTLDGISEYENPYDGLISALDVSAKYNQSVSRPYILIDTKDKKFNIVG